MKRLSLLSFFMVLLGALTFTSCNTEPIDSTFNDETNTSPASFQVNIGSELYQATTTTGVVQNNILTLTAVSSTGTFVITVPAAQGTYTTTALIKYTAITSTGAYYSNVNPTTAAVNGQVVIASYNATTHKVSGTFNFTGYWSDTTASGSLPVAFSSGIFTNISFTSDTTTPTDFVFKVDHGGTTFTATTVQATLGVGMISILGTDAAGRSMGIQVYATQPGEYSGDKVLLAYIGTSSELLDYSSFDDTAVVNITSIDATAHTFTGTFHFTGQGESETDTLDFTNGVFTNVPYVTDNLSGDIMKAKVGDISYDYKNSIAYVVTVEVNSSGGVTFPTVGPDHWIIPSISTTLTAGSYDITASGAAQFTYKDAAGTEYVISNGTLGITSNTGGRIAGTFSFDVTNTAGEVIKTVRNGSFDIDYNVD